MAVHSDEDLAAYFLGERIFVNSSNIHWIKYDLDAQWLTVGMKHGGVYLYIFTTPEEAEDFARAGSQGKWVWEHCIRIQRPFERLFVPTHWPSGNEPSPEIEPTI